jgi:hypothetical protein
LPPRFKKAPLLRQALNRRLVVNAVKLTARASSSFHSLLPYFELFGCNFFPVPGGRSRYAPAGTQTLFADAISAFATFVEMLTLCSPSLLRGIA